MLQNGMSYIAVLIAAVLSMAASSLWFSSLAFGKIEPSKGAWLSNGGYFLSVIVKAYVLAYLIEILDISTMYGGLKIAALIWLGFEATSFMGGIFWDQKSLKWYLAHAGQHLVVLLLMGFVIIWLK